MNYAKGITIVVIHYHGVGEQHCDENVAPNIVASCEMAKMMLSELLKDCIVHYKFKKIEVKTS